MIDVSAVAEELKLSFVRLLIGDVLASRERLAATDTQRHRRDVVRATLAAIEGVTWIYREHIRDVAKATGVLTPVADLALRERTFSVSDQGNIVEQVRFVTLPTIIRLTTKQAQLIEPTATIDFAEPGWSALRTAIGVRNRVTHPKNQTDLQVSQNDIETIAFAFAWLLGSTEAVRMAINASLRAHLEAMRSLVDALKRGDQQAVDDYHAVFMADENS